MSRTLVLVRHGDALGREPGQTDAQRSLSDAGKRALEEAFPRTLGLLDPTASSELWVSPALRARQTAEIANKTLGIEATYQLKCLFDQDHDEFLDTYAGIGTDLVVAVGHIPFMEDMTLRLCGANLSFAPGAACAIDMGDAGLHGHLLWFVQGPQV